MTVIALTASIDWKIAIPMKQPRKQISRKGPEETEEIMLPAKISIPFFQSFTTQWPISGYKTFHLAF